MLFDILKSVGLDVPATIDSLKADFDRRVEEKTAQVSQAAVNAAVLAALYTLAAVAALLAIGVGLVALCLRLAENFGVYVGLGVICAILLAAALLLGAIAAGKSRSLPRSDAQPPRPLTSAPRAVLETGDGPRAAPTAPAAAAFAAPQTPMRGDRPTAGDLVQPLALLLSNLMGPAGQGRPMAAALLGALSKSGAGVADKALERATNVVRDGDRSNLVAVLAGAAFVGWLMTRFSGQE